MRAADDFEKIREAMEKLKGETQQIKDDPDFVDIDTLRGRYLGDRAKGAPMRGWDGGDGARVQELLGCRRSGTVCYWNANYECLRDLRCKG